MWEELKVYKLLEKKDINPTFKKFGMSILSHIDGYSIDQTNSIIKLSRQINQLEQSVFIEKDYTSRPDLKVRTGIKPVDFYKRHKFTLVNIVSLGDIMNSYRRTFYPLTQEWHDLAFFLATRIKTEIEDYFLKYNSYDKIIDKRGELEPKDHGLDNKYELLIYAAIRSKNKSLLNFYLDKKIMRPATQITQSEYLKPDKREVNEKDFLHRLKTFAETGDFDGIENEIETLGKTV